MKRFVKWWGVAAAAGGLAGGVMAAEVAAPAPRGGLLKQLSQESADTVEKVMPSVVVIRTQVTRAVQAYDLFWGRVYTVPEVQAGQGSGMIYDKEGHVLTSRHVVADAQEIEVILHDETVCTATVVGTDPSTDLAVLRLEWPKDAPAPVPITPGDSDRLRVGEFVIAIGSPFSLRSSVTLGVVSQKGRSVGLLPFEDFIQTDAPINPGNSGGPLVDVEGRLVGINAVIQTANPQVQGSIGIGFAVPVNLARQVADSIIRTGQFERPWIGIAPRAARRDGKPVVLVAGVYEQTPAEQAGIRPGDIIEKLGGQAIQHVQDLQRAIVGRKFDERIPVELWRRGRTIRTEVQVTRMPTLQPR